MSERVDSLVPDGRMACSAAQRSGDTAAGIRQGIVDLLPSGAHSFDPVRLRFIETMARRAGEQKPSVRAILEQKALTALADYQADFLKAQGRAGTIVTRILERFPDSAEQGRSLFDSADFSAVDRLQARLNRESEQKAGARKTYTLGMLTKQIGQGAPAAGNRNKKASFSDLLQQAENAALESAGRASAAPGSGTSAASDEKRTEALGDSQRADRAREPLSVRQFRELLLKLDSEKLVTQAIKEGPAAPGPLNAQALVIRTLATLRALSPGYLSRFVCYADTLLWLEKAGERSKPARLGPSKGKRDST